METNPSTAAQSNSNAAVAVLALGCVLSPVCTHAGSFVENPSWAKMRALFFYSAALGGVAWWFWDALVTTNDARAQGVVYLGTKIAAGVACVSSWFSSRKASSVRDNRVVVGICAGSAAVLASLFRLVKTGAQHSPVHSVSSIIKRSYVHCLR